MALCFFLAVQFIRADIILPMKVSGSLFSVAVGAFALCASDLTLPLLGDYYIIVKFMGVPAAAYFWIFAQTLFNDKYRFRLYHLLPLMAILSLHIWHYDAVLHDQSRACRSCTYAEFITLGLFLHVPFMAFQHLKADLIQSRRSFRWACGLLLPLIGIYFSAQHIMELSIEGFEGANMMSQAVLLMSVALVFSLWFTTSIDDFHIVKDRPKLAMDDQKIDALMAHELARLKALVEEGVFFEEGLTIGKLADRMNVPEHRLRMLINKGLGYRNFPAFLNDHRIEIAKQWLLDPQRGREQIVQIAYALGYASLAPFNRAFRERVGVSPTQFRADTH